MSEQKNEIINPLDIGELAQRAALKPEVIDIKSPDGASGQVAVVPTVDVDGGRTVKFESVSKFFDEYRERPRRRVGTANLADLASLVAHVNRFKDGDSALFADTDRRHPCITAVLDYHCTGSAGTPRFGQHRSRYSFPVSEEWTAWTGAHGKELEQAKFAEFIETYLVDALEPTMSGETAKAFAGKCGVEFATPARLLELSRGLSINVGMKLSQAINLQSGVKQIQFEETHADKNGDPLKVPGAFLIGIPVFRADARYQVCVRLRYRKREGGMLVWVLDLWRHEEVFDHAIMQACETVKKGTELPLLVGTPEQ